MSVQEQKPLTTEAGVVEPTPAPAQVLTSDVVGDKVEEPVKTEEAVAPVEEKKEVKAEEPIYSGALGYKAPGLKNAFRFSKKYFWFGEEEPVSVQSLTTYLRGEKADVAHPTAAWSSQTGKGLLYFVKHADEKATPAGVLNLSEATDVSKDGTIAFHFKLHGHKHTFEAQTLPERNGWFMAFEKAIEEAKAAKENIVSSESYKEELAKLNKPATLGAAHAKESSAPKKSLDATPKLNETTEAGPVEAGPARAGSSSSSSSDEEKKAKKAAKNKSRSVSRKRASIFGGLLGKKDKAEEKVEEKKEEHEAKKEVEATPAAPAPNAATEVPLVAPVIPPINDSFKAVDEPKAEETTAIPAIEPVAEEKKVEEKPKPTKRGSIFGSFVEKMRSPTAEKKEADMFPAPAAKEPETTAVTLKEDAPVAPVVPTVDTTAGAEAPKVDESKTEEVKPATSTPAKESKGFSFGKFLGGAKEKVKSPSTEKAPELPKTEEPVKAEEPAAAPVAATEHTVFPTVEPVEAPKAAEAPKEEKENETPTTTPAPKAKRGSIFGNLTGSVKKSEGDSEKPQGIMGLFRNASKAGKPKKDKEAAVSPKVEEAEPTKVEDKKDEVVAEPAVTEAAPVSDITPAVPVGQEHKSTPQVSTTA